MTVAVFRVKEEELQETIQVHKDNGSRILALSPAKIVRGNVTEYTLAVGK